MNVYEGSESKLVAVYRGRICQEELCAAIFALYHMKSDFSGPTVWQRVHFDRNKELFMLLNTKNRLKGSR